MPQHTLRVLLCMTKDEYARLLGVDERTVKRWEAGTAKPQGSAEAVIAGLEEAFRRHPVEAVAIGDYIRRASAVGGVAYLLVCLLDDYRKNLTP